jgi:hypothetical protein
MDKINHIIRPNSQKNYEKRIIFPYSQTSTIAFDAFKKYKSRYENILDKNKQDLTTIKSILNEKYVYGKYSLWKHQKIVPKIINCLYYNNLVGVSQLFEQSNPLSLTDNHIPISLSSVSPRTEFIYEQSSESLDLSLEKNKDEIIPLSKINNEMDYKKSVNEIEPMHADLESTHADVECMHKEKESTQQTNCYDNETNETKPNETNETKPNETNETKAAKNNSNVKVVCESAENLEMKSGKKSNELHTSKQEIPRVKRPHSLIDTRVKLSLKNMNLTNKDLVIYDTINCFSVEILKMKSNIVRVSNPFLFSLLYSLDVLYLNWYNILNELDTVEKNIYLFERYITGEIYKSVIKNRQKKYIDTLKEQDPELNSIIFEFISGLFNVNIIVIKKTLDGDLHWYYPKDKKFICKKKTVFIVDNCPTYQTSNEVPNSFWNLFFKNQIQYKSKLSVIREYISIFDLKESIDSKSKKSIIDEKIIPFINLNFPQE